MQADWSDIRRELATWRAEGLALPIWWRDDDAVTVTPALERLAGLSAQLRLPVHLAVVPKTADDALAALCAAERTLVPLVHGWAHQNHAPEGQKKAEFGHPRPGLAEEAAMGLARLRGLFGPAFCPVFVPPWNRICPEMTLELAPLGFAGLSTFTPRGVRLAAPGLVQINTHLDPVHWRGGGGLVAEEVLLAQLLQLLRDRRAGRADRAEPLGLLTHHLVHDGAIWAFTETCLKTLLDAGAQPVDLRTGLP